MCAPAQIVADPGQFAGEECPQAYPYPEKWLETLARPEADRIAEEVSRIEQIFGLDGTQARAYLAEIVPTLKRDELADGRFAIPALFVLRAKWFPRIKNEQKAYCAVVRKLLAMLGKSRPVDNWLKGQITSKYFRMHEHTARAYDLIAKQQSGDIWIVEINTGRRDGINRSARRFHVVKTKNESGLEAVAALSLILLHPERLVCFEELDFFLIGNEGASEADGVFSEVPVLYFDADQVRLDACWGDGTNDLFGSGSVFLPQSLLCTSEP